MPEIFTPHLYSFVPDRGFGVTPRASHVHLPAPCGTYQPLDIDAPDPDRPWRPGPSVSVIRLGPGASGDAWINHEKPGALLVMRDGDTHDGARYGFSKLDLWPLVGYARPRGTNFPPPPIEIGALQVGLALADAWGSNTRLAVVGPTWALDLLEALPGSIVCEQVNDSMRGKRGLHVTAWGRRWRVDPHSTGGGCPFEVAARLSGASPLAHDGSYRAVGSMLFRPSPSASTRMRVVATSERHQWQVSTDLGVLTAVLDADHRDLRWPSAEDPWLLERVGDGEEVST